jgi:hypothetical protein
MEIFCQKRYDEIVAYAEKIGDKTIKTCLDRLQRWETTHEIRGVRWNYPLTSRHTQCSSRCENLTEQPTSTGANLPCLDRDEENLYNFEVYESEYKEVYAY